MQHNDTELLWIKFYSERNLTRQGSSQKSMQSPLACNTAPSFIGEGRRKGLVDVSNQCSSYGRTVSCILTSTAGNSIPIHHVPFLVPRISKPTSVYLHCLWINARDWLENRWANCSSLQLLILWDTCHFYKVLNTTERNFNIGWSISGHLYQEFCN